MTNLQGINRKNKHHVKYPDVPSAIKPVPHGPGIPIPTPPENYRDMILDDDHDIDEDIEETDASSTYLPTASAKEPIPFSQAELNDLTRDLCLSKESAQLLGSRLCEHNVLTPEQHLPGTVTVTRNFASSSVLTRKLHWCIATISVNSLQLWEYHTIYQSGGSSLTHQKEA
ncbi:uncharacterized protein LOC121859228 [Homarus americanus]|uniref:uncharacterized protein LOC121859228 n=1 Tax=Homarus americanus TaxID=6706 RepID=UPI001C492220|nr:uncharacterized protein LOC121859228 [Homarus americanus]